jgi:hypothetical protein
MVFHCDTFFSFFIKIGNISRNTRFFCWKSVWDFQKWTKKMSKNRKSQNSLEKNAKNFSVTIKKSYGLTPKK